MMTDGDYSNAPLLHSPVINENAKKGVCVLLSSPSIAQLYAVYRKHMKSMDKVTMTLSTDLVDYDGGIVYGTISNYLNAVCRQLSLCGRKIDFSGHRHLLIQDEGSDDVEFETLMSILKALKDRHCHIPSVKRVHHSSKRPVQVRVSYSDRNYYLDSTEMIHATVNTVLNHFADEKNESRIVVFCTNLVKGALMKLLKRNRVEVRSASRLYRNGKFSLVNRTRSVLLVTAMEEMAEIGQVEVVIDMMSRIGTVINLSGGYREETIAVTKEIANFRSCYATVMSYRMCPSDYFAKLCNGEWDRSDHQEIVRLLQQRMILRFLTLSKPATPISEGSLQKETSKAAIDNVLPVNAIWNDKTLDVLLPPLEYSRLIRRTRTVLPKEEGESTATFLARVNREMQRVSKHNFTVTSAGEWAWRFPLSYANSITLYTWIKSGYNIYPAVCILSLIDSYGPSYFWFPRRQYQEEEEKYKQRMMKHRLSFSKYSGSNEVVSLVKMWNDLVTDEDILRHCDASVLEAKCRENRLYYRKVLEVRNVICLVINSLCQIGFQDTIEVMPFDEEVFVGEMIQHLIDNRLHPILRHLVVKDQNNEEAIYVKAGNRYNIDQEHLLHLDQPDKILGLITREHKGHYNNENYVRLYVPVTDQSNPSVTENNTATEKKSLPPVSSMVNNDDSQKVDLKEESPVRRRRRRRNKSPVAKAEEPEDEPVTKTDKTDKTDKTEVPVVKVDKVEVPVAKAEKVEKTAEGDNERVSEKELDERTRQLKRLLGITQEGADLQITSTPIFIPPHAGRPPVAYQVTSVIHPVVSPSAGQIFMHNIRMWNRALEAQQHHVTHVAQQHAIHMAHQQHLMQMNHRFAPPAEKRLMTPTEYDRWLYSMYMPKNAKVTVSTDSDRGSD